MFLRNCWYAAAFDHEVADGPFARTLLGEPVVLYRTADGTPVAFEDACCHRALPLSMGTVIGDNLQCGYHGLTFDPSGVCVSVPGQARIPSGARVRSFPVVERFGWIWIWMGDPALADSSLLPDWHWAESEDWRTVKGNGGKPLAIACNYELVTDNLYDISHLSYVHATSIGTETIVDFPVKTERLERSVTMTRLVMDRPPAPFYRRVGNFKGNVDRWLITPIDMPSNIVNHAGCVDTGADMREGHRGGGIDIKTLNATTPETETSSHYFWAHARGFGLDDPAVDEMFRTSFAKVFHEDKTILEAQQASMSRRPGRPMIDINSDGPGAQTRKLLREMIAAETGGAARAAAE